MCVLNTEKMCAMTKAVISRFSPADLLDLFLVALAESLVYGVSYLIVDMSEMSKALYFTQSVSLFIGFAVGLGHFRLFREARCPVCDKAKEYVEI